MPIRIRALSLLLATWGLAVPGGITAGHAGEAAPSDVLRVWCHQGQESEHAAMREIAAAFNAAHASAGLQVVLEFFPDFQFTEKLAIAAAARDLPDAFDLDGPLVARFAAAGLLAPLDRHFSAAELDDFLPTIRAQGTIAGKLCALGAFDSAAVLYFDRELCARAGVTVPPAGTGWTWDEFLGACAQLRAAGIEPVALHFNETADEWYTYAFSPVVWSGGGQLIAEDGRTVRGVLASEANILSLRAWQSLFARGFAATDPVDPDPFGRGAVALDWSGHWMARAHVKTKGARLGVMPLPRIGPRPVAPCGSWCWAISAHGKSPARAAAWLRWVTSTEQGVIPIVRANGAAPARRSAFAAFPEYAGDPYRQFRTQLESHAQPRPRTEHYAVLTRGFAAALRDIARGSDVAPRLLSAEDEIQAIIDRRANRHATTATAGPGGKQ